jgi:virginiamycin B lyase
MPRLCVVASASCLVMATWLGSTAPSAAQGSVVLAGKVTVGQEALEGVLVSAQKSDSSITVTVVSGKDGSYSFPAGRLEPGQYSLRIRAIGYDLDGPDRVMVASDKATMAGLALRPGKRYRLATDQRRVARKHAGQRCREGTNAQLRRLPHAGTPA